MAQMVKKSACNAGDPGLIPGLGVSLGEGNCNPLQYSCLGNPMGRGAWCATVHGVAKSQTRLSDLTPLYTYVRFFSSEIFIRLILHLSKSFIFTETDMFFLAISMVGTDFSMIGQLFPHRARIEIKVK